MWTSTLELSIQRVLPTQILSLIWRGAYFSGIAPLQIKNLPRAPQLVNGNWVRVRNRLAGISDSDLHLIFGHRDRRTAPMALPSHGRSYPGYEIVGEIIEVGAQVQNLRVGDRVVRQNVHNCLSTGVQSPCRSCATGHYNLCEHGELPGPHQIGGGWSEEMLLHEQLLFRIPKEMEDEQAVMLEPTAVALHAVLRHPPQAGDKVLIVGADTIGLLILQVLRALIPQVEVSVLAQHSFHIEQATRLGAANIIYNDDTYRSIREVTKAKLYRGIMGNKTLLGGYNVIYDTEGSKRTIHDNLRWTCAGGTVIVVGASMHQMKLDLSPIWHQEINLIGNKAYGTDCWPIGSEQRCSTFSLASDMITKGMLHPERLITHRFALSNFREALQTALNKQNSRAIKVVFDAALLPAPSAPNTRPIARPHRFPFGPEDLLPTPSQPLSTEKEVQPASAGPSPFTMAQSEDFTADFDKTRFSAPKPRRTPVPLQFHTNSNLSGLGQNSPSNVTNQPSEALQDMGKLFDDSTPQK